MAPATAVVPVPELAFTNQPGADFGLAQPRRCRPGISPKPRRIAQGLEHSSLRSADPRIGEAVPCLEVSDAPASPPIRSLLSRAASSPSRTGTPAAGGGLVLMILG